MKTQRFERVEEHHVILEQNIDFLKDDLEQDKLAAGHSTINAARLTEIAKEKGFDSWRWVDFEKDGEVEAIFRKTIGGGEQCLTAAMAPVKQSFYALLQSDSALDCELIIGDVDMPASFVWDAADRISAYGLEKYRPIMDAPYTLLDNGTIEVHCDNDTLGEQFCMAAAGYVGQQEYDKLFVTAEENLHEPEDDIEYEP